MPDNSLKAILEQRHPVYTRLAPEWQYYADHYDGGPRYPSSSNPLPLFGNNSTSISRGVNNGTAPQKYYGNSHYLWQYPLEKTDKYIHRLNRAVYVNIVAPVVDFYCATIGKQENILIDVDENFQGLLDDIDRQGLSFHQYMSTVRKTATVRGVTFLFVDSPTANVQPRTQRDANEMGLRPYVVEIKPEDLLNWRLDEFGRPLEILYRVKTEVPGSILSRGEQVNGWVYRHWTRTEWRSFIDLGDGEVAEGPTGVNPLGVIPIVPLYHHRLKAWEAQSLLKDSAKIGQLVTNWCSSLDEGFETQMFAIPVIKSRKTPTEVGAGSAVVMHLNPEEGEEFLYVTPDVGPFEAGWDAFYRMIQLANKHMGIAPKAITTDTLDTQSGVSKQWDFFEAEKILATMATNEQEAAKLLLMYAGLWMGAEFTGSVQYATKYDLASVAEDISDMVSLQAAGVPLTARKEMMRRVVAKKLPSLDEATQKKINSEIDKMADVPATTLAAPGAPPSKPKVKPEPKDEKDEKAA